MSEASYRSGGNGEGHHARKTPDVSHVSNPDVKHEVNDVRVGPIAKFVVGLFIFAVVVHVLMWVMFTYFERREQRNDTPTSPIARTGDERLPPEPRLQAAPGFGVDVEPDRRVDLKLKEPQAEMKVVNRIWEEQLTTYGWVDQGAGTVRIPIEEAKKLMLRQQEAKAQSAPPANQSQQRPEGQSGVEGDIPAASSSGRTLEKRDQ